MSSSTSSCDCSPSRHHRQTGSANRVLPPTPNAKSAIRKEQCDHYVVILRHKNIILVDQVLRSDQFCCFYTFGMRFNLFFVAKVVELSGCRNVFETPFCNLPFSDSITCYFCSFKNQPTNHIFVQFICILLCRSIVKLNAYC